jgi:hypothetical protein
MTRRRLTTPRGVAPAPRDEKARRGLDRPARSPIINPPTKKDCRISEWVFPIWMNGLRSVFALSGGAGLAYVGALIYFGFSPLATDVGYMPNQPVAYSHALHAGKLGLDCRYCHTGVDDAAQAGVPPTQFCMGCHANILPTSEKLKLVRDTYDQGRPIQWVRVHDLPDYAYFNHSAHVRRGVGCATCHGRIDRMEVVYQAQPLSMQWCLECHRSPERYLRPLGEITNMDWALPPDEQLRLGRELMQQYGVRSLQDCSTCHR